MLATAARGARQARTPVLPVLAGFLVAAFLLAPRAAPPVALALVGVLLAAAPALNLRGPLGRVGLAGTATRNATTRVPAAVFAIAGFAVWSLVTILWAADPVDAVGKVLLLAAFIAIVTAANRVLPDIPDRRLHEIARAAFIAFAAGLAYLAVEELTDHAIKRLLFTLVPWFRPSAKHASISADNGEVTSIAGYVSNRSMAALTLTLWPMLLLAWHLAARSWRWLPRRWVALAGLVAVAGAAMAMSEHDTSVLAIAAAIAVLALTRWLPRTGIMLVAAGWLIATLAVAPITDWAFRSAELHKASWLPHTAQQRIILWGYTAQQVAKRPLLGVGADSTKPLDARRGPKVETPAGFSYQWRTGPHGHNIFLQTWYELGLPGALLLCAFGLLLLRAIARLDDVARPVMAAAFVSATITAAFTWGLWQPWFLGAFTLSGLLCLLALELHRRVQAGRFLRPDNG